MGHGMDKILKALAVAALSSLALLAAGCLENQYVYKFNLDGSCDFTAVLRGDSSDVYEPSGAYPAGPVFQTRTWTEYDSAGKATQFLEAKARFARDSIPPFLGSLQGPQAEYLIQHPVKMSVTNLLLLKIFKFEQVFKSRQRAAWEGDRWKFIPAECKVLENGGDSLLGSVERTKLEEKYAAGMLLWNANRYNLRFKDILERTLKPHPGIAFSTDRRMELLARLDSLVNSHSRFQQTISPSGNLDMVSLEWWYDLAPVANVYLDLALNPSGDEALRTEIRRIEELLEFRHKMDEDVADETYSVRVDLPGRVVRSNTEVMEKGVMVWRIVGQDLQDSEVTLQASSLYLMPVNILAIFAAVVILIFYVRARGIRRHRESLSGPPPPRK